MTQIINSEVREYLQNDGLTQAILDLFKVTIKGDKREDIEIRYPYFDGAIKICRPYKSPGEKWKWENSSDKKGFKTVFGLNQLPKEGEQVFIAAGEKDVLTFYSLGYPSICLNSETQTLSPNLVAKLKERFKHILVCYDADETGQNQAEKIEKKFGLPIIKLPEGKYGKDITDFIASGKSKINVEELIEAANQRSLKRITYFKAGDLKKMVCSDRNYLISTIIPANNIIGIIGGSDSGKSLLCFQFSMAYILEKEFLGYKVNGGRKVLYFSFEDGKSSLLNRYNYLISELPLNEFEKIDENLFFELSSEDCISKIKKHLKAFPETGLIIIDPFSELMAGEDINSLGSVRMHMKNLYEISLNYDITILLIHHISKHSEGSGKANKLNSLGSSGYEAKTRVLIELTSISDLQSQLAIVKGNDISREFKYPNRMLLINLQPHSLWFIRSDSQIKINHIQAAKVGIDWRNIFENEEKLSSGEINRRIQKQYGKEHSTAEKIISNQLKQYRTEVKGIYLNPNSQNRVPDLEEDFQL